jgi:hypothetical protein
MRGRPRAGEPDPARLLERSQSMLNGEPDQPGKIMNPEFPHQADTIGLHRLR